MFLPANGLPKRARFLAILGLIFLTLIHVSLGFLEGDRAPKLNAPLRPFFSSWSFIFWNGWKASIVLPLVLGSISSIFKLFGIDSFSRCFLSKIVFIEGWTWWFLDLFSALTLESWNKRHYSRFVNFDWTINSFFSNSPLERRCPIWEQEGKEKECSSCANMLFVLVAEVIVVSVVSEQVHICILFIYLLAPTPQLWPGLVSLSWIWIKKISTPTFLISPSSLKRKFYFTEQSPLFSFNIQIENQPKGTKVLIKYKVITGFSYKSNYVVTSFSW